MLDLDSLPLNLPVTVVRIVDTSFRNFYPIKLRIFCDRLSNVSILTSHLMGFV